MLFRNKIKLLEKWFWFDNKDSFFTRIALFLKVKFNLIDFYFKSLKLILKNNKIIHKSGNVRKL